MHEKGFYKTTLHLRPQWDCLFTREMKRFVGFLHPSKSKPYLGVVFVQLGYAGMTILAKTALDKGMSQYVFVAYRQIVATIVFVPFAIIFDRKVRTKMTFSLFFKIVMLGLLEPVVDQNLFYAGMKLTTATFAAALCNVLPAFAFLMAWACRLEKVNILKRGSQAKIIGTIVTVGGAMIMTFITGPMLNLPWTKPYQPSVSSPSADSTNHQSPIKGSLMIAIGCISWSAFIILQAITLKWYPAELSLTALICLVGSIGDTGVALVMERGSPSAWALHLDTQLLAVVYGGVMCSGIAYYIQGVVMQTKGPVFVSAFNPLSLILVAIMSSFILCEIMFLGRIIGAVAIMIGLYMVLWGKAKDQASAKMTCCEQQQMGGSSQEFVGIDVGKEGSN
ncbi:WAT1-related protein At2g39510-like isoform X2 [Cucurbita pepo subsp. pepo]|uniref:WAT1-related protein At2g39510-like isoform X2 n=1 Tax=Cucurbita pepo subsp. pepo TaxID=3664 RepID=UPI000C9DA642|nr:WAT1-related protein At2g39510-like isoform X2 [Cucurbita pepo subsp. pepo]